MGWSREVCVELGHTAKSLQMLPQNGGTCSLLLVTSGALRVFFVDFNLFHAGFMEWYLEVYRKYFMRILA